MEIISILRHLAAHRVLLAAGLLLATVAALSIAYQISLFPPGVYSRMTTGETKSARVLIDAPDDPSYDVESTIAETLGMRATLLSDLLSTGSESARIARAAGVDPDELVVLGPSAGAPPLALTLAVRAAEAARSAPAPYKLIIEASERTGIIKLTAGGADPARTAAVVEAATSSLRRITTGSADGPSSLRVVPLGPIATTRVVDDGRRPLGIAAGIILFGLWCGAIVVVSGLRRRFGSASWHGAPWAAEGLGAPER